MQFPLCSLAFGGDPKERFEHIFWYCTLETGRKLWGKLSNADCAAKLNQWENRRMPGRLGFNSARNDHRALRFGCEHMRANWPHFPSAVGFHARLAEFVSEYESRYGRDCLVRVRTELIFEALKQTGISEEELHVLIAVKSALGDARFKRIGRETIRCRALGYKSTKVMVAELTEREDRADPLSAWKLRARLETLHSRKFFARCTYGRRLTYYSTKLKDEALLAAVFDHATRRHTTHWVQKNQNQALTDAVRNHRATLAGKPLPAPHALGLPAAPVVDPMDLQ